MNPQLRIECCIFLALLILPPAVRSGITFTSTYGGTSVYGAVGSSAQFSWSFSGGVATVEWGMKRTGVNDISERLMFLSTYGPVPTLAPPASYSGRVSGIITGGAVSGQVVFTLSNIQMEDEVFYGCKLTSSDLNPVVAFDSVRLIVEERPNITHPTAAGESVNEGSHVNISCTATGKRDAEVRWIHNGQVQVSGSRTAHLIISQVTRMDAGVYTCRANNPAGSAEKQFNLIVNYPASITRVFPPSPHESWATQFVTFACKAIGVPTPAVIWKRLGGSEIKRVVGNQNIVPQEMETDGNFGQYTCEANNYLGSAALRTVLVKQIRPPESPNITIQDKDIMVTSVLIQWTTPADDGGSVITAYKVVILHEDIVTLNETIDATQTKYLVKNLSKSTSYTLRVSAMNKVFEGSASEKTVTTKLEGVSEPVNIIKVDIEDDKVTITWDNPEDNGADITQYSIFKRTANEEEWTKVADVKDISKRVYVFEVDKGKMYELVVTATNKYGESAVNKDNIKTFEVPSRATPKPLESQTGSPFVIFHVAYITVIAALLVIIIVLGVQHWRIHSRLSKKCERCAQLMAMDPMSTAETENEQSSNGVQTNEEQTYETPIGGDYMPLHPSTRSWEIQREQVNVIKVIGKGAFSQVAQATVRNLPGQEDCITVAVKMLKENAPPSDRTDLLSELELIEKLKPHAHVIKLVGCVTESDPLLVLIEYVPFGDLLGYLRKSRGLNDMYFKDPDVKPQTSLTAEQLIRFAWQIADGMFYLSSKKIIHRDLAARNVLVGEGEKCKVTDFGMARNVQQDDIYTKRSRGRLPVKWTAYEALMYGTYTTQSDVWSYGVLLYEILTVGGSPYPNINARSICDKIQEGYRLPKPTHVDDKLYQIMRKCWEEDPNDRPTFVTLRKTMKDMEKNHRTYVNLSEYNNSLYDDVADLAAE